MHSLRILVIEDNYDLAANLVDFLEASGHSAEPAGDGITGLHLALVNTYDVVVLDVLLPGMDGITLCDKLRSQAGKTVPVLMLTARDSIDDRIRGLDAGADDYLVKPFSLRELEARIRALARRAGGGAHQRLQVGDLLVDTTTLKVTRGWREVELPPIPFRILKLLMRASPRVLDRQDIIRAVWGDTPPDSDALRAHIHVLRSAIDQAEEKPLLHTVRGMGYQIADHDAPPS